MNLWVVMGIIFVLIVGLAIYKFTKSVFRAIFLALSAVMVLFFTVGILIFMDALEFQEKYPTQPSLYILEDTGKFVAGFSGVLGENFDPEYVSSEELSDYQTNYLQGDIESILKGNYKIFVIDAKALSFVETVNGSGIVELTLQDLQEILSSDNPVEVYIEKQLGDTTQLTLVKQNLLSDMGLQGEGEFKGAVFGLLFAEAFSQRGPLLLFEKYQEDQVAILPESFLIKLLKRMPLSILKSMIVTR